jgi:hypothetical protein
MNTPCSNTSPNSTGILRGIAIALPPFLSVDVAAATFVSMY